MVDQEVKVNKKIVGLDFTLVTRVTAEDYTFIVGADDVLALVELPDHFIVVFEGNIVRGYQREFIPKFGLHLEDVKVPKPEAKSPIILPKAANVVSLDEARAAKTKKK